MSINIYNGTQHTINIFSKEDTIAVQGGRKLILKEEAVPIKIILAGTNLNAQTGNLPAPSLDTDIPLYGGVTFTSHDPLPEGYDIYIVSNLFRSAVKELGGDTSRLATVFGTVYASEEDMRPCGCLGLSVG
ncbi:hypothetical protein H6G33_09800 [Calothrix sp. FACHB-1219]|uniref:hypothetical protein n=1 Tax=unclassified Calothrix TaxID=2619626 RepID=UPI0016854C66|nr:MULTISPECIES: hypothetical protein [unclassified Calothrix]MBD2201639.1 hypothetical protein [Calothrix sp. FACHB-168]MBD2217325.1 hypothetical protein [Calothrix sp. FACHB-1219]